MQRAMARGTEPAATSVQDRLPREGEYSGRRQARRGRRYQSRAHPVRFAVLRTLQTMAEISVEEEISPTNKVLVIWGPTRKFMDDGGQAERMAPLSNGLRGTRIVDAACERPGADQVRRAAASQRARPALQDNVTL